MSHLLNKSSNWRAGCFIASNMYTASFVLESYTKLAPRIYISLSYSTGKEKKLVLDKNAEKYIPLTRASLISRLMKENILNEDEKRYMEKFTESLDSIVEKRYYGLLEELKVFFDPLNPDRETLHNPTMLHKSKQESEYWMLQKLKLLMERCNFHEIPKDVLQHSLSTHAANEGVMVKIDPDKYQVFKLWALGRGIDSRSKSWHRYFGDKLRGTDSSEDELYKRVVIALRERGEEKLRLKLFKDIPVHGLEQLFPSNDIQMHKLDKAIILSMSVLSGIGLLTKGLATMANTPLEWSLVASIICGGVAAQAFFSYSKRKQMYLTRLFHNLYCNNIANNRALLTLLVDRARDETFKEALLSYTFLVGNRSSEVSTLPSEDMHTTNLGGLSEEELYVRVESWVRNITGTTIAFDSSDALSLLHDLGLVVRSNALYYPVPLAGAFRMLPSMHRGITSLANHSEDPEVGMVEGFELLPEPEVHDKLGWKLVKKGRLTGWL